MNPFATENVSESMKKPEGNCIALSQIDALHCRSAKRAGTQRRTKILSLWYVDCIYCGRQKGMSWNEATSNSEKKNQVHITLLIVKLCFTEHIN